MKIEKDLWIKLINAGVQAPSGDNSQPWKFLVKDDVLRIFSLPERDNPAYNLDQKGSLVAIGALIENIALSASALGYLIETKLFPDQNNENAIADLYFSVTSCKKDELVEFINSRCTNRKPYSKDTLKEEDVSELFSSVKNFSGSEFKLVQDSKEIELLAKAASVNERVVLENYLLHKYFFSHVCWTDQEEAKKRSGLYLKTLEFDKPTNFFFHLFKNWYIMNLFNRLGFARLVAATNAKIYSHSAAIGLISLKADTKESYIEAGRELQRIWLAAEKCGLSFQMITGVLYFMHRIRASKVANFFTKKHCENIVAANSVILSIFKVKDVTPVLMFRVGYGGRPSGNSSRLSPEIIFM